MPLPTLLLIHGAWHDPRCWYKVLPLLEAKSFKCRAPHMLFAGHEPPVESVLPDVKMLQKIIKEELDQGNDVIILGHSLGGLLSSSCVQGLLPPSNVSQPLQEGCGSIMGMIQISSILIPSSTSPNDVGGGTFPPFSQPDFSSGWVKFVGDPADFFYSDLPRNEAEEYITWLGRQSLYLLQSRESVYAGHLDLPVWYIYCTEDHAIPFDYQQQIVAGARAAGAKITTGSLDAGHSPFYSQPKKLVDLICEAVNSWTGQHKGF